MQGRGMVVAVAVAAGGIGFGIGAAHQPAADAAGIQKVQDARVLQVLNQINRKLDGGLGSQSAGDSLAKIEDALTEVGVLDYGGAQLSELLYKLCVATAGGPSC
jgi:hypothetical protein